MVGDLGRTAARQNEVPARDQRPCRLLFTLPSGGLIGPEDEFDLQSDQIVVVMALKNSRQKGPVCRLNAVVLASEELV
jgi:hypothetical protein